MNNNIFRCEITVKKYNILHLSSYKGFFAKYKTYVSRNSILLPDSKTAFFKPLKHLLL